MLVYATTFKSFGKTVANQDLSTLTHVTKDLTKRQISSNSDPNIAEGSTFFFKNIFATVQTHPYSDTIENKIFAICCFLATTAVEFT